MVIEEKKVLFGLILVIALFFIAGCTESTPPSVESPAEEPATREMTTPTDIIQKSADGEVPVIGSACKDIRDCQDGNLCFGKEFGAQERGQCISDTILKAEEDCRQEYPRCTQRCENCKDGEFYCFSVVRDTGTIEKCVECSRSSDCKTGYICKEYGCIAE